MRTHQDISKLVVAIQFSVDAKLNAARFASKAIVSPVMACCMLWLCHWQADTHHKWLLASAPFKGEHLFGDVLDTVLVESRDKRKVLLSFSRKGNFRVSPYYHRPSFWATDTGAGFPQDQGNCIPRQRQHPDRSPRGRQSKRPFRGGGGHSFCRPK